MLYTSPPMPIHFASHSVRYPGKAPPSFPRGDPPLSPLERQPTSQPTNQGRKADCQATTPAQQAPHGRSKHPTTSWSTPSTLGCMPCKSWPPALCVVVVYVSPVAWSCGVRAWHETAVSWHLVSPRPTPAITAGLALWPFFFVSASRKCLSA